MLLPKTYRVYKAFRHVEFDVSIFYAFCEVSRQRLIKSVQVGPNRFIVMNDSASPRMVIIIYFIFSIFLKVLELDECRRCDPHMTV